MNNSSQTDANELFLPLSFRFQVEGIEKTIHSIIVAVISIVTMVSNVMTLVTIYRIRWLEQQGMWFLLSLAVADLIGRSNG